MSEKKNDQVNNEAKNQAEEKENQELVQLTLEEAETEAQLIKAKATDEAQKIIDEAQKQADKMISSGESFTKELKNAKYIAVNNIKEDGETIKKGTAYNGKNSVNITKLLNSGAIKLNK